MRASRGSVRRLQQDQIRRRGSWQCRNLHPWAAELVRLLKLLKQPVANERGQATNYCQRNRAGEGARAKTLAPQWLSAFFGKLTSTNKDSGGYKQPPSVIGAAWTPWVVSLD